MQAMQLLNQLVDQHNAMQKHLNKMLMLTAQYQQSAKQNELDQDEIAIIKASISTASSIIKDMQDHPLMMID